jgi:DNA-binding MarR family transcriptional regulator
VPKTSSESSRRAAAAARDEDVAALLDALRRIVRELRLAARAAEQEVGVHGARLHALRQLVDGPVASLTELAERTRTDISSVSVIVSRLVEQGLVERQVAADDRRRLTIGLTARGRALVRRAPEATVARLTRATRRLTDRDVRALSRGLGVLADALVAPADD